MFIRSRLDYASTLWHSSLTINNRKDIERIQKSAMKVIFGREYQGYEKSLKLLKMECLNERREKASLKVAKKIKINLNPHRSCLSSPSLLLLLPHPILAREAALWPGL